ncbi:MAG: alpha/beta hydrolase [Acidobacteria bacterium]|nr:alpha/beta hydrolase [Acidobacteriota bacterium]
MRLASSIFGAALVLFLGLVLFLRWYQRAALFPASQVRFPEGRDRGVLAVRSDPPLAGAFFRAEDPAAPAILYFHGNGESAAHNVGLADFFVSHGHSVFLAEYRGYGGQPGTPTEDGLLEDARDAWKALDGLGVPAGKRILMGRSLGAAVAAGLAADLSAGPPALVVLVSPFTSVSDMARPVVGWLTPLAVRDRFDTAGRVPRISAPLVIVHGTHDEVIPFAMGEALARSRPGSGFVAIPRGTHNDLPGLDGILLGEIEKALVASGIERGQP